MANTFDYKKHFEELLIAVGDSLNALVEHYDGLTIEFKTTGTSTDKVVENHCVVSNNVKPKEN